jgi:hypothetical protein
MKIRRKQYKPAAVFREKRAAESAYSGLEPLFFDTFTQMSTGYGSLRGNGIAVSWKLLLD